MIGAQAAVSAPAPLTLPDGRLARELWSLDRNVRHLNHGSYGAVPRQVQQVQQSLRNLMQASPSKWFTELPARMAGARRLLAPLLSVASERLAFVPNASGGATAVFRSLILQPGDEVVVTDHGYGAVVMGAERLARRHGGTVRVVHLPLGAGAKDVCERVEAAMSPRTRLLVIDQITSATARRLPVDQIVSAARRSGAMVLVDGAHAPGIEPSPVGDEHPDFWIGNLHKWCCAPPGSAAIVSDPETAGQHLDPLIDSWGAHGHYPENFDVQGTVDVTAPLVAHLSFQLLDDTWGWETIRTYQRDLADYAEVLIADALTAVTGEDHRVDVGMPVGPMRLVRLPQSAMQGSTHDLRDHILGKYGVAVAITEFDSRAYLRISTHAYSVAADFEDFADRVAPELAMSVGRQP